jgi:diacylglycerol kinase (ATP)
MSAESNKPGATGITRVINAFGYSMKGLRAAFIHEAAFRQELLLCVLLLPLALWLGRSGIEQALLVGSLFLVLIVELANSAIEAIVDRVGSEMHELSGRAKDIGSAAVLLALLNLFVVWVLLLCDRFI